MTWQHRFDQPHPEGPFPQAHAYVNISLTDGTFLEFGFNLRTASSTDDVERALAQCETGADVAACLYAFVQRGEEQAGNRHLEWRVLTNDEVERARRLVDEVSVLQKAEARSPGSVGASRCRELAPTLLIGW